MPVRRVRKTVSDTDRCCTGFSIQCSLRCAEVCSSSVRTMTLAAPYPPLRALAVKSHPSRASRPSFLVPLRKLSAVFFSNCSVFS